MQRVIYKKTDLTLFQAKFLENLFKKRFKCNPKNIKVLPNNCIKKTIKIKKVFRKNKKKISIGFAAPMYWSCKGLENIIKLYKELVHKKILFKFEIAGKGPHEIRLRSALNKISNKHFTWNGWVNNIDNFFDKIDLLIVPSLYDSSPNLVLEALQKKKIIFASDINAHREILKDNDLLFSTKNTKHLSDKILKYKKSKNYKKRLQKKINIIKKDFTFNWEKKFSTLVVNA